MGKADRIIKIEQELKESRKREALLASLLENSSQPFGVGYPDGRLGLVNKAFEKLTGYSREELKSTDWSEILTPKKFRDMENEKLEELQRTCQPVRYEKEYIMKDGARVPIELLVHIVKNENGSPEYYYSFITDISERKKAEEALQQNEAEISFLLELNDALRQIDDPIQIQETASRLLGEHLQADRVFYSEIVVKDDIEILVIENDYHRPGVSSLTGQFVFKEFSQTDYEDYRAGRTVSSPNVFTDEREPIQREAYRTVDVSAFIGAPLIKRAELVSVLGVLHRQPRNWTLEEIKLVEQVVERTWHAVQQMRAEKALQESEEKYRNIIELANEGTIIADPSGMITYVNTKITEMLGYSSEELIGTDVISLVDKEEIEFGRQKVENRTKGIQESYEIKCRRKNGAEIWFLVNATPMFDNNGKHIGNMTMQTDITERKKVEYHNQKLLENEQQLTEELQSSNEELQSTTEELYKSNEELQRSSKLLSTIYELNPDAIVLTTVADSKIIDCNQEYLNQIGYSREEVIGHTSQELNLISEVTREAYIEETRGNQKVSNIEIKGKRKDGSFIDVQYSTRQIKVNDEPIILNIGHDITESKKAEKQMETTMDELRRSNEELERFAYVSSHDLQEPLRMVKLYSQLLERRYKDNLDSDADDFIEYIVEGSNRMKQLIDDLLEYSRVNSQTKELENVGLEKVLDTVLHNLSISIVEYNVTISHDPLPTVFANQNQMVQVFQNLITNSIKFHGPNPPEINISTQKDEKEWVFAISDKGIGIKPEHQKQIFEVFKRLHTKEEYPGTGIGLSIIKKIIINHGGRIWVESEPEKGSTFYFTIPIK